MKKTLALILAMVLCIGVLAACGGEKAPAEETAPAEEAAPAEDAADAPKAIDELVIYFVHSREPAEIITATEPLKELLKAEMLEQGYEIGEVKIEVGTTYEAVGEALSAGTAHIGLIPANTYVTYDDGCDVILTATRAGLSKDFDAAKDWNDGQPTEASDAQAVSYRALMIAGPSEKGQELAAKVNAGEELTWDDINSANWSVMGVTSPAGYVYPALWMHQNFGKTITDLASAVQADSYTSAFARLASGQIDVLCTYADARRDNAERWNSEFGREASIWEETNVIGVTPAIYNDTISVTKSSDIMDADMIAALQNAFINIANAPEGKDIIAIYNHEGYQVGTSADYDTVREAQELAKNLK